jgi:hypothetical protein
MIRATAEGPRRRRILRSGRRDRVISNLLGEWCFLITTGSVDGQSGLPVTGLGAQSSGETGIRGICGNSGT